MTDTSEEYEYGFEIVLANGSTIKVGTEDRSWREDPSRLKGMDTSFTWVPGEHYSELGAEGAVWALQQGAVNALAVYARLLPIPRKYNF